MFEQWLSILNFIMRRGFRNLGLDFVIKMSSKIIRGFVLSSYRMT